MPNGHRPIIRSFPRADRAFQEEVERLVESQVDLTIDNAHAALEALLRRRYPGARVNPQDPLASFGGDSPVWYVYRRDAPPVSDTSGPLGAAQDAAGGPPAPSATAASVGAPSAGAPVDASGRSVHASRPIYSVAATAAMVGVPVSILVGWEEQYGYVKAKPTPSGVRLHSRDDVEDLLSVKRQTAAGATPDAIERTLAESRARRDRGPFGEHGAGRRMLVLLAERDPYAAEMAEYFLRTEGYDVDVAFGASEAEGRAADRRPDVSVVELLISGGGGAELCARLKEQTGGAVIAISTLDVEDAAMRSGADAFLTKPLDPLMLISTIKDLLGESALVRPRVVS
jgi:CheY-like chemotaxis protein